MYDIENVINRITDEEPLICEKCGGFVISTKENCQKCGEKV